MTTDRTAARPRGGGRLPEIVGVEAARVRYPRARVYYVGTEKREASEAVELLVRTSKPLPVRDLTPVLFIGETPVPSYRLAGPSVYRFYVFDFERLPAGAPLALGWPHSPRKKVASRFRYQPPRGPAVA